MTKAPLRHSRSSCAFVVLEYLLGRVEGEDGALLESEIAERLQVRGLSQGDVYLAIRDLGDERVLTEYSKTVGDPAQHFTRTAYGAVSQLHAYKRLRRLAGGDDEGWSGE